jgi:hypothetical protein
VNFWINKRVTPNDSWTPLGRQPEFLLRPRHLRDAQGNPQLAHPSIEFPSGFLADGWRGVNFVPMPARQDGTGQGPPH